MLRRNTERGEMYAQDVPLEVFELASDMWEPPDEQELAEHDFRHRRPPPG